MLVKVEKCKKKMLVKVEKCKKKMHGIILKGKWIPVPKVKK